MVLFLLCWIAWNNTTSSTEMVKCFDIFLTFCAQTRCQCQKTTKILTCFTKKHVITTYRPYWGKRRKLITQFVARVHGMYRSTHSKLRKIVYTFLKKLLYTQTLVCVCKHKIQLISKTVQPRLESFEFLLDRFSSSPSFFGCMLLTNKMKMTSFRVWV